MSTELSERMPRDPQGRIVGTVLSPVIRKAFTHLRDRALSELMPILDIRIPSLSRPLTPAQRETIKSLLQPGDLLLNTDNSYPGWQIAEKIAFNSSWTHIGLYIGD